MRIVGKKLIPQPQFMPSAAALEIALEHQATGASLMRLQTSGVRKGIYRFANHETANQANEDATILAIVLNQQPKSAKA